jgi:hypothetical protein
MAEKAKREKEAQEEEDRIFEERRQAWLEEHAAEQEVRTYVDQIARAQTADPPGERERVLAEMQAAKAESLKATEQPEPTQREKVIAAKKLRAKISKATKAKVAADKFNAESAKTFAEKQVRRLEQEGKL